MKPLMAAEDVLRRYARRATRLGMARAPGEVKTAAQPPAVAPAAAPAAGGAAADGPPVPPLAGLRMAEYVLLTGIPVRYLIPDPALLPDESLRFFHIDTTWMQDLLAGILSIGLGATDDDATDAVHDAVSTSLPLVRDNRRGRAPDLATTSAQALDAAAGSPAILPGDGIAGFLLRSTLVTRYPNLIVHGWVGPVPDHQSPEASGATLLEPLRLERLTPSILVALWIRPPDLVMLQEPPGSLRLGVRPAAGGPVIRVRNPNGIDIQTGGGPAEVSVPVDADGVIDLTALAGTLAAQGFLSDQGDPAALAMHLLQPPARRRFRREGP